MSQREEADAMVAKMRHNAQKEADARALRDERIKAGKARAVKVHEKERMSAATRLKSVEDAAARVKAAIEAEEARKRAVAERERERRDAERAEDETKRARQAKFEEARRLAHEEERKAEAAEHAGHQGTPAGPLGGNGKTLGRQNSGGQSKSPIHRQNSGALPVCTHEGELNMWCEGKARFFRKAKSCWKKRNCRVLTHWRDADRNDVGPALEYRDGEVALGTVLLDECKVWTSALLEGEEDGFSISQPSTKATFKFAANSEFQKNIWINSLSKAIADHLEEMRALAPSAKKERRKSIGLAKRAEAAKAAEQEEVVLTAVFCKRSTGVNMFNQIVYLKRKFQLITHGRDVDGTDVGPKLLYYDEKGKHLKGAYLLDGASVQLCAHVGRCDFGFDISAPERRTLHLTSETDDERLAWVAAHERGL